MHVGIVAPCSSGPLADLLPQPGGMNLGWGAHFMTSLVRALINRGHRVSVVTLSPEVKSRTTMIGDRLSYYVYPTRLHRRMRDLFRVEREGLAEGIRLAKPEVLHAHWTYEFALACIGTRLPTLVTSHDNGLQIFRYQRDFYRFGRLCMQISVLRQARFVSAVSPYIAHSLRWLTHHDIPVVGNPIEVPPRPENDFTRTTRPIRIATALMGWGNLKNPKAAIKAFALFRKEMPDAEMLMYGADFEQGGIASQWAKARNLAAGIRFCGYVPPTVLHDKLRNVSMLLHPSREEACPIAVLEAMARGLPIIGGQTTGGLPWVLDEGRAGFLTDVTSPRSIAETMLHCIQNDAEREQKRTAGYRRVSTVFSPDAVAGQYETLYHKVLSS